MTTEYIAFEPDGGVGVGVVRRRARDTETIYSL